MRTILSVLCCWVCIPFVLHGDAISFKFGDPVNIIVSPDKSLKAQVIRVAHGKVDRSYDVIRIFKGDTEISEYPFTANADGMARLVYAIKWAPDSKFLVILTKYGGGHSVWHSPTSIYDVKHNDYWEFDDYSGSVVGEDFEFIGPDTLKIKVQGEKNGPGNDGVEKRSS